MDAVKLLQALKDIYGDASDFFKMADSDYLECRHCGRTYWLGNPDEVPASALDCAEDCPGRLALEAIREAETEPDVVLLRLQELARILRVAHDSGAFSGQGPKVEAMVAAELQKSKELLERHGLKAR